MMRLFLCMAMISTAWMRAGAGEAERKAWSDSYPDMVWATRNLEGTVLEVQEFENPTIEHANHPLLWVRLKLTGEVDRANLAAFHKVLLHADHGYADTKKQPRPPGDGEALLLLSREIESGIDAGVEVGDQLRVGAYQLGPSSSPFGPDKPRGARCDYKALLIKKPSSPKSK